MKKLFRNPVFALFLTAALVIVSTLISADVKLSGACERVTDGFYSGIRYNREKHPAAAQCIRTLCADAEQMVIIGDNYGIDTKDLLADTAVLKQTVGYDNPDIASVYAAFDPFCTKLMILEDELSHTDLSDRHAEQMKAFSQEIAQCRASLESSGYNESVTAFLRKNNGFPTRQFAALFGITYPPYFA